MGCGILLFRRPTFGVIRLAALAPSSPSRSLARYRPITTLPKPSCEAHSMYVYRILGSCPTRNRKGPRGGHRESCPPLLVVPELWVLLSLGPRGWQSACLNVDPGSQGRLPYCHNLPATTAQHTSTRVFVFVQHYISLFHMRMTGLTLLTRPSETEFGLVFTLRERGTRKHPLIATDVETHRTGRPTGPAPGGYPLSQVLFPL